MLSPKVRTTIEAIRPLLDPELAARLSARAAQLAPAPALGRLDQLVTHYGLIRGTAEPVLRRKGLIAFAADHGVAPGAGSGGPDQTLRDVRQFLRGGSAAQVLCRHCGIEPLLVNVGLAGEDEPGALNFAVAAGALDMTHGAAMSEEQTNAALEIGLRLAGEAAARFDVVGLAQIGAGGEISAAALLSAFSGRDAAETTLQHPATLNSDHGRNIQDVRSAVVRHQSESVSHFGALRTLGGLDIAAMAGFLLGAAVHRLPVVLDGFTAGAAALVARAMAPDSPDVMIFSHRLASPAHAFLLQFLAVEPVHALGVWEAQGFGAALGIQALETALLLSREVRDLSGSA